MQSAEAAIESAAANVDVLKAQQEEATRTLQQFQTSLAKAERDLSFTVIRAPFDGVVGNRAMQSATTCSRRSGWPASYRSMRSISTPTSRRRRWQAAAGPAGVDLRRRPAGQTIEGRVASFAPASGSVFSLLPPDNATGNFTKIVQRLPVRILVPAEIAEQSVLRPGMSVIVKVNTKPGAPAPISADETPPRSAPVRSSSRQSTDKRASHHGRHSSSGDSLARRSRARRTIASSLAG